MTGKNTLAAPLRTKKEINRLALFFALTYMVSYITRINYAAILSELERSTGIPKSLLSMAPTGSFITYGVGQVVSGVCGDRFSPKKLICAGLIVSSLMNLLIPACQAPWQITCVWCVNGFAQAFLWPPLVRLMCAFLSEEEYKKTTVKVAWGSSLGTIAVYLISPLIISVAGWRAVFVVCAACGIAMALAWSRSPYEAGVQKSAKESEKAVSEKKKGTAGILFSPLMLGIMAAIVLQGMLRDGVTTWMPSFISDTYKLSSRISILTNVVLPIFSISCFYCAEWMYRRVIKNPLSCAGAFFGAGAAAALGLVVLPGGGPAFSVLFAALLTGCMHGVNLMLISMIPAFFKKHGMVSTVSGVLNSCTYIGSAVSTYGVALLSESFGWQLTLVTWLVIGAVGTLLCLICARPWEKKFGK